jgi:hypothetical protein
MSVRGEFRRLLGDLVATLREARVAPEAVTALEPLLERARDDLSGAAETALALLARLDAAVFAEAALRQRFEDAQVRLEAVCRIILGR